MTQVNNIPVNEPIYKNLAWSLEIIAEQVAEITSRLDAMEKWQQQLKEVLLNEQ